MITRGGRVIAGVRDAIRRPVVVAHCLIAIAYGSSLIDGFVTCSKEDHRLLMLLLNGNGPTDGDYPTPVDDGS